MWECPKCTLLNEDVHGCCDVCRNPRPIDTTVPEDFGHGKGGTNGNNKHQDDLAWDLMDKNQTNYYNTISPSASSMVSQFSEAPTTPVDSSVVDLFGSSQESEQDEGEDDASEAYDEQDGLELLQSLSLKIGKGKKRVSWYNIGRALSIAANCLEAMEPKQEECEKKQRADEIVNDFIKACLDEFADRLLNLSGTQPQVFSFSRLRDLWREENRSLTGGEGQADLYMDASDSCHTPPSSRTSPSSKLTPSSAGSEPSQISSPSTTASTKDAGTEAPSLFVDSSLDQHAQNQQNNQPHAQSKELKPQNKHNGAAFTSVEIRNLNAFRVGLRCVVRLGLYSLATGSLRHVDTLQRVLDGKTRVYSQSNLFLPMVTQNDNKKQRSIEQVMYDEVLEEFVERDGVALITRLLGDNTHYDSLEKGLELLKCIAVCKSKLIEVPEELFHSLGIVALGRIDEMDLVTIKQSGRLVLQNYIEHVDDLLSSLDMKLMTNRENNSLGKGNDTDPLDDEDGSMMMMFVSPAFETWKRTCFRFFRSSVLKMRRYGLEQFGALLDRTVSGLQRISAEDATLVLKEDGFFRDLFVHRMDERILSSAESVLDRIAFDEEILDAMLSRVDSRAMRNALTRVVKISNFSTGLVVFVIDSMRQMVIDPSLQCSSLGIGAFQLLCIWASKEHRSSILQMNFEINVELYFAIVHILATKPPQSDGSDQQEYKDLYDTIDSMLQNWSVTFPIYLRNALVNQCIKLIELSCVDDVNLEATRVIVGKEDDMYLSELLGFPTPPETVTVVVRILEKLLSVFQNGITDKDYYNRDVNNVDARCLYDLLVKEIGVSFGTDISARLDLMSHLWDYTEFSSKEARDSIERLWRLVCFTPEMKHAQEPLMYWIRSIATDTVAKTARVDPTVGAYVLGLFETVDPRSIGPKGWYCLQSMFVQVNNEARRFEAMNSEAVDPVYKFRSSPPPNYLDGENMIGRRVNVLFQDGSFKKGEIIDYRHWSNQHDIQYLHGLNETKNLCKLTEWHLLPPHPDSVAGHVVFVSIHNSELFGLDAIWKVVLGSESREVYRAATDLLLSLYIHQHMQLRGSKIVLQRSRERKRNMQKRQQQKSKQNEHVHEQHETKLSTTDVNEEDGEDSEYEYEESEDDYPSSLDALSDGESSLEQTQRDFHFLPLEMDNAADDDDGSTERNKEDDLDLDETKDMFIDRIFAEVSQQHGSIMRCLELLAGYYHKLETAISEKLLEHNLDPYSISTHAHASIGRPLTLRLVSKYEPGTPISVKHVHTHVKIIDLMVALAKELRCPISQVKLHSSSRFGVWGIKSQGVIHAALCDVLEPTSSELLYSTRSGNGLGSNDMEDKAGTLSDGGTRKTMDYFGNLELVPFYKSDEESRKDKARPSTPRRSKRSPSRKNRPRTLSILSSPVEFEELAGLYDRFDFFWTILGDDSLDRTVHKALWDFIQILGTPSQEYEEVAKALEIDELESILGGNRGTWRTFYDIEILESILLPLKAASSHPRPCEIMSVRSRDCILRLFTDLVGKYEDYLRPGFPSMVRVVKVCVGCKLHGQVSLHGDFLPGQYQRDKLEMFEPQDQGLWEQVFEACISLVHFMSEDADSEAVLLDLVDIVQACLLSSSSLVRIFFETGKDLAFRFVMTMLVKSKFRGLRQRIADLCKALVPHSKKLREHLTNVLESCERELERARHMDSCEEFFQVLIYLMEFPLADVDDVQTPFDNETVHMMEEENVGHQPPGKSKYRDLVQRLVPLLLGWPKRSNFGEAHDENGETVLFVCFVRLLTCCIRLDTTLQDESDVGGLSEVLWRTFLMNTDVQGPFCKTEAARTAVGDLLSALSERNPDRMDFIAQSFDEFLKLTPVPLRRQERGWGTEPDWDFSPVVNAEMDKTGRTCVFKLRNRTGFVGLLNRGSTCYMNAVLQQLFAVDVFRDSLLSAPVSPPSERRNDQNRPNEGGQMENQSTNGPEDIVDQSILDMLEWECICSGINDTSSQTCHICGTTKERALQENPNALKLNNLNGTDATPIDENQGSHSRLNVLRELQRVFRFMRDSVRGCYDPYDLVTSCKSLKLEFPVTSQNDASEFYDKLLDTLEEAMRFTNQVKVMMEVFSGKQVQLKRCHACGLVSTCREESFYRLLLMVKNSNDRNLHSLEECLDALVEPEVMSGDNKVDCPKCMERTDCTFVNCLTHLPKVLVILPKRFSFDLMAMQTKKLNHNITFPRRLNMHPYTREGALEESECQFHLAGVLVHRGRAGGGHYYSFIRTSGQCMDPSDETWIRFDDNRVCEFFPDAKVGGLADECFGGSFQRTVVNEWGTTETKTADKEYSAFMLFYDRDRLGSGKGNFDIGAESPKTAPKPAIRRSNSYLNEPEKIRRGGPNPLLQHSRYAATQTESLSPTTRTTRTVAPGSLQESTLGRAIINHRDWQTERFRGLLSEEVSISNLAMNRQALLYDKLSQMLMMKTLRNVISSLDSEDMLASQTLFQRISRAGIRFFVGVVLRSSIRSQQLLDDWLSILHSLLLQSPSAARAVVRELCVGRETDDDRESQERRERLLIGNFLYSVRELEEVMVSCTSPQARDAYIRLLELVLDAMYADCRVSDGEGFARGHNADLAADEALELLMNTLYRIAPNANGSYCAIWLGLCRSANSRFLDLALRTEAIPLHVHLYLGPDSFLPALCTNENSQEYDDGHMGEMFKLKLEKQPDSDSSTLQSISLLVQHFTQTFELIEMTPLTRQVLGHTSFHARLFQDLDGSGSEAAAEILNELCSLSIIHPDLAVDQLIGILRAKASHETEEQRESTSLWEDLMVSIILFPSRSDDATEEQSTGSSGSNNNSSSNTDPMGKRRYVGRTLEDNLQLLCDQALDVMDGAGVFDSPIRDDSSTISRASDYILVTLGRHGSPHFVTYVLRIIKLLYEAQTARTTAWLLAIKGSWKSLVDWFLLATAGTNTKIHLGKLNTPRIAKLVEDITKVHNAIVAQSPSNQQDI